MPLVAFDEMQDLSLKRMGQRSKFQWQDIVAHENFMPQHKRRIQRIIVRVMGYLPYKSVYFPHQAFMRAEFDNYIKGLTTEERFWKETLLHVLDIRNDDMFKSGYLDYKEYGSLQQQMYNGFMPDRIQLVRKRLSSFLGYEPDLVHSYDAEMWLREAMRNTGMAEDSPITAQDYRAITITKYREIFLKDGEREADCSYFSCERPEIDVFKDDDAIYETDEFF